MTITELVVTSAMIGLTLAAVGELVAANTFASTKLTNKIDGQVGTGRAIRRISEDVRHARVIGNVYSTSNRHLVPDSSSDIDPFNVAPSGGWPGAPWPSTPYVLGPRTLIIQQPILYEDETNQDNPVNGFPLRLQQDSMSAGVPKYTTESVYLVVYQVVPDPEVSNQYLLQVARFTGSPNITGLKFKDPINPPQTILKGIVGPNDDSSPGGPAVFQYLNSANGSTVIKSPIAAEALGLVGVSINIEAQVPAANQGANLEVSAVHAEAFIRASKNLKVTND